MESLRITTAIPFGYLFIFAIFLFLSMVAIAWLIYSIRRNIKPIQLLFSTCTIIFLALVLWSNLGVEGFEWNPLINNDAVLYGAWATKRSELTLNANSTYTCGGSNCGNLGATGQWKWDAGFFIEFEPSSRKHFRWRLAEKEKTLRLVSGAEGDPDMWNTHVEFTQVNRANIVR